MIVVEYEGRFYELARHDTMILPAKYKHIQCLLEG